jgi:hypothetical protein
MRTLPLCALCAALSFVLTTSAFAGPIEDLSARLTGRSGTARIDNTQEKTVLRVFGEDVKGSCQGDRRAATVKITKATGTLKGDTAAMDVAYDGSYEKTTCGGDGRAPEMKPLTGHYVFQITSKPFQPLQVSAGDLAPGFGAVADRNDESNRLAVEAIRNAITGAL